MTDKGRMTPGPWIAIGTGIYQADEAGDREIVFGGHLTRSASEPERKANARAIACLPELVEAVRAYLHHTRRFEGKQDEPESRVNLRRILARIDGETGGR